MNQQEKLAHLRTAKIFGMVIVLILAVLGLAVLLGEYAFVMFPIGVVTFILYTIYKHTYEEQLKKIKREEW